MFAPQSPKRYHEPSRRGSARQAIRGQRTRPASPGAASVLEPRAMVPEKYRLAAVGKFLLEAFELRRPGLTAWTPELERDLLAEAQGVLQEMERQCREFGTDDPGHWKKAREAVRSVLLPRYAALARSEIALAKEGYRLWRGGDLFARLTYAGAGAVLGIFIVKVPWIPITWELLPLLLLVAGPLLPDAQLWYYRKRHERRLQALVDDLGKADRNLDTYRPLSELQAALGEPASFPEPRELVPRAERAAVVEGSPKGPDGKARQKS